METVGSSYYINMFIYWGLKESSTLFCSQDTQLPSPLKTCKHSGEVKDQRMKVNHDKPKVKSNLITFFEFVVSS
ncbi:hypothetical protein HanHA89_Chr08g0278901 [Helianthus annuus]|nr:hypothetical protein HanHA89_Chr08g0278901 [Helianthus annuus]